MENTLCGLLVIIFVSSRLSSAQYVSNKTGTFQVLQKHPKLNRCAADILQENENVGVRVSEQTGECEALPRSWGLNQTIESGYAYAKKLSVEERVEPPLKLSKDDTFFWNIPGVLHTGARLDVLMTIPNPDQPKLGRDVLTLEVKRTENMDQPIRKLIMVVLDEIIVFAVRDGEDLKSVETVLPAAFSSKKPFTVSFSVQEKSIKVELNGEELHKFQAPFPVTVLNQVSMWSYDGNKRLHSLQFTG